ncbi:hypothetical protein AUJ84_00785 [Candidatus Pacearchaeota archaeon CG1_02_32_132]|nr:MAG: hypothetical protein AUJ84_00785 [Candidatus Pacearchaeota archaeon CG1_02_32_132]
MISKTKIKERARRKNNPKIVETVRAAHKNPKWANLARILSGSRKNYSSVNLNEIDKETREGDTVIIVGKVLGNGKISKRVRICAVGFSKEAKEKIKNVKGEAVSILEEININNKAEGVKIIK